MDFFVARETLTAPRARAPSAYFVSMATLLLAIVLAGFSPTLYLRAFVDAPPIPPYLYAHGAILTGWFVWLFIQTIMIRTARVSMHRRLGWIGAALAVFVAGAGLSATFGVIPRIVAHGVALDEDIGVLGIGVTGATVAEFEARVVWGDIGIALAFIALLAFAVALRSEPSAHKRLMLLASIAIIVPALARISRLPGLGGEDGPFVPVAWLLLLASPIGYDIITRKRPHRATVLGVLVILAAVVGGVRFGSTHIGQEIVRALA